MILAVLLFHILYRWTHASKTNVSSIIRHFLSFPFTLLYEILFLCFIFFFILYKLNQLVWQLVLFDINLISSTKKIYLHKHFVLNLGWNSWNDKDDENLKYKENIKDKPMYEYNIKYNLKQHMHTKYVS